MFIIKKHLFLILSILSSLFFLYKVKGILLPFIIGFFIAYLFKNIVKKYEKIIPRKFLSIICVLSFTLIIVSIILFIIPIIFNQITSLTKDILKQIESIDVNKLYSKTKEIMHILHIENTTELKQYYTYFTNFLLKSIGNITNSLVNSSFQVVNIVFMIFISPIVAFYLLKDWNNIFNFFKKQVVPKEFRANFSIISKRIDEVLHHYIIGQFNVCLILGTYYSAMLFVFGFKYAFVVGITAGFLTLLPYVGAFCGASISLLLGYFQFGFVLSKLLIIFVIFSSGQFLEGNFVTPNLIGNKIKVHPLWLVFSILSGGALYGFWGIIISMPIAAVIGVLIRFYFEKKNAYNRQKKINRAGF